MNNEETNYDLTIKTKKHTFQFITELKDIKSMLEKINYKEIESVRLEKRRIKNGKGKNI